MKICRKCLSVTLAVLFILTVMLVGVVPATVRTQAAAWNGYNYGGGTLYVYSYRNGKAVPLDVRFPQMNLSSSTEMEDHFMDVAAASGTTYAIYKSSEKNRFIICATISDEDSQLVTCEYTNRDGRFILALRQLRKNETAEDMSALMAEATEK